MINGITEDSKVFPSLLRLDSGCGYFQSNKVFTYDMINIEIMKLHLHDNFPGILFFFYINNDTITNTDSYTSAISINEFYLLKNIEEEKILNLNYNKCTKNIKLNNID